MQRSTNLVRSSEIAYDFRISKLKHAAGELLSFEGFQFAHSQLPSVKLHAGSIGLQNAQQTLSPRIKHPRGSAAVRRDVPPLCHANVFWDPIMRGMCGFRGAVADMSRLHIDQLEHTTPAAISPPSLKFRHLHRWRTNPKGEHMSSVGFETLSLVKFKGATAGNQNNCSCMMCLAVLWRCPKNVFSEP